jgi:hypothetical protein
VADARDDNERGDDRNLETLPASHAREPSSVGASSDEGCDRRRPVPKQ